MTDLQRHAEEWMGKPCRDGATGFFGTATAVAFYLGAGPKLLIEAPTPTGDAKTRWVDIGRVEATEDEPMPGAYG